MALQEVCRFALRIPSGQGFRSTQARPRCCREAEPWLTKETFRDRCFRATQPRLAAVVNERPAAAPSIPHIEYGGFRSAFGSRASLGLSFDTSAKTLGAHRLAPVRKREAIYSSPHAPRPQCAHITDRGTVSDTNGAARGHGFSDRHWCDGRTFARIPSRQGHSSAYAQRPCATEKGLNGSGAAVAGGLLRP
jgi:hypothetical protein